MEIREYALAILEAEDLELKLVVPPEELSDLAPGPALRMAAPGRSKRLRIRPGREVKVPAREGMNDPAQRVRILHAFANHELQAVELFAWAILAFPGSHDDFRRGLVRILADEQRHTRMYLKLLQRNDVLLGDFGLSGYFWHKVDDLTTPLKFISAMAMTFETANLDYASEYGELARQAGDEEAAVVIDQIHRDEIEHVGFGWKWLNIFKRPEESAWDAWCRSLAWPLRPARAIGRQFDRKAREAAGIPDQFLDLLEESASRDDS
jgi:uncharacterized ferritin-like protein (DUF455 family)